MARQEFGEFLDYDHGLGDNLVTASALLVTGFLLREIVASRVNAQAGRILFRRVWPYPLISPVLIHRNPGSAQTVDARGRAALVIWKAKVYECFAICNLYALRCAYKGFYLEGKGVVEVQLF